jgi:hypothetical protein
MDIEEVENGVVAMRKRASRLARRAPADWRGPLRDLVDHLEDLEDEIVASYDEDDTDEKIGDD